VTSLDIDPSDRLLTHLQSANGVVDIETVELDSPGVAAMRSAGIKLAVPLMSQGELVGVLALGPRRSDQEYSTDDRRLLDALAARAAPALRVGQLVRQQHDQLQRSRERIVTSREEERRRIRRDLHDGLGPSLATASMQLEVARDLVRSDPREAEEILRRLSESTRAEIAEIRRLVDDLRPPILDELGLASALQQRAANFNISTPDRMSEEPVHLRWTIEAGDLEPLPAAVEVAAYRIVIEAVNNAAKHADASRCHVTLLRDGAALTVSVSDNGRGLPEDGRRFGVGMGSMRERAEELGGALTVSSGPQGTTIDVRLPLGGNQEERDDGAAAHSHR
jgi:signal transduction histidine kinase